MSLVGWLVGLSGGWIMAKPLDISIGGLVVVTWYMD